MMEGPPQALKVDALRRRVDPANFAETGQGELTV